MAKTNNTAVAAVPAGYVPSLKKVYKEEIVAKLMKEFGYSTVMQCPKLVKITINEGVGDATGDKKLVEAGAFNHHWTEGGCHSFKEGHLKLQAP